MNIISKAVSLIGRSAGHPPSYAINLKSKQIRTIDQFFKTAKTSPPCPKSSISIDLGCGNIPRNPLNCNTAQGIDIAPSPKQNVIGVDLLTSPIPYPDQCADVVTAYDFIEHVPRCAITASGTVFPFVGLMREIYRVLKPGGLFFSKTPAYPSSNAFVDPTHVNVITEDTFATYFCNDQFHPLAAQYGFKGEFKMIQQRWWGGGWLITLIQKPTEQVT